MKNSFDNYAKEGLHEECGVFGIFGDGTINPAYACYNGLLALQHRGQESCGIAVTDDGVIDYHKDMGLVTEVFNNRILDSLQGQMGIAHVSKYAVSLNRQVLFFRQLSTLKLSVMLSQGKD